MIDQIALTERSHVQRSTFVRAERVGLSNKNTFVSHTNTQRPHTSFPSSKCVIHCVLGCARAMQWGLVSSYGHNSQGSGKTREISFYRSVTRPFALSTALRENLAHILK